MYGQENKFDCRASLAKLVSSFYAGENWHAYVQYDYVWSKPLCFFN